MNIPTVRLPVLNSYCIPVMDYNIKSLLQNNGFVSNHDNPVYVNLYNSIKKVIVNRTLPPHSKLPSSRVLAKDLDLSRSTILKAYDLLLLEKYVKSVKGSGYYVLSPKNKKIQNRLNFETKKAKYPSLSEKGNACKKMHLISKRETKGIAFRPGLPPLDLFPVKTWKKITTDYWKNIKPSELSYSNSQGLLCLRENIANYLKVYRNIDCSAQQILITSGSLHSLYLISSVLLNKHDEIVTENPTYPQAYRLFKSFDATIHAVNIDDEGIDLKRERSRHPKFIYTTPSCQYPLGIKMSMKRRSELLQWASKKNTLIIEDDYDHEFSNWEKPFASLHSLDNQQRVVYLGTFNKLLHPSLRLGYMIVPDYLLDAVTALNEQSNRFIATSLQKPLSTFIEQGHLNKHLRNVIQVTSERKRLFTTLFSENFTSVHLSNPDSRGLQLIATLPQGFRDIDLTKHFKNDDIIAHPLSKYYIDSEQNGLVMGYSSVNVKLIRDNILKMAKSFQKFEKNRISDLPVSS